MSVRSVVLCDTCDNVFDLGTRGSHADLTRAAHENGWTSTYDGGWKNACDECNRKTKEAA